MKRPYAFLFATLFGLLAIASAANAQNSPSSPPETTAPPMTHYHDAERGFDYSYPNSFISNSTLQQGLEQAMQKSKVSTVAKCVSWPLAALDASGTSSRLIMLVMLDTSCSGEAASADQLGIYVQTMM